MCPITYRSLFVELPRYQRSGPLRIPPVAVDPTGQEPLHCPSNSGGGSIHRGIHVLVNRLSDDSTPSTDGGNQAAPLINSAAIGVNVVKPRDDRHHASREWPQRRSDPRFDVSPDRFAQRKPNGPDVDKHLAHLQHFPSGRLSGQGMATPIDMTSYVWPTHR
jgi:hypothetical protein